MSNGGDNFEQFFGPGHDEPSEWQAPPPSSPRSNALPLSILVVSLVVLAAIGAFALATRSSSDRQSASGSIVTVTQTAGPASTPPSTPAEPGSSSTQSSTASSSTVDPASITFPDGTRACGNDFVVDNRTTQCNFAAGVVSGAQQIAEGETGTVRVWSPNVKQYYSFSCVHHVASYIHCTGKGESRDTGTPEVWVRPTS